MTDIPEREPPFNFEAVPTHRYDPAIVLSEVIWPFINELTRKDWINSEAPLRPYTLDMPYRSQGVTYEFQVHAKHERAEGNTENSDTISSVVLGVYQTLQGPVRQYALNALWANLEEERDDGDEDDLVEDDSDNSDTLISDYIVADGVVYVREEEEPSPEEYTEDELTALACSTYYFDTEGEFCAMTDQTIVSNDKKVECSITQPVHDEAVEEELGSDTEGQTTVSHEIRQVLYPEDMRRLQMILRAYRANEELHRRLTTIKPLPVGNR